MKGNVYEWYVVYTKAGMEKKVAKELQKKSIESYCPLNKVESKWWKFKKTTETPLFSSYVFVRVSSEEVTTLKKIDGVVNVLYWLGKPAVVQDFEIATIKNFLVSHSNVSVEKTAVSYNYIQGSSTQSQSYKVNLPTLGYAMVATNIMSSTAKVVTMAEPATAEAQLMVAG